MEFRLKILSDAGVINAEVYSGMLKVVDKLENHWQLKVRNPQGEMAMTHMANALMRAHRGEFIEAMDSELFSEVQQSELFETLQLINRDLLSEFDIAVPDNEISYLLANLYGLHLAQQD